MKKICIACLTLSMAFASVTAFAGCSSGGKNGDKLQIVTTIFPEYDWVRQVLGEEAENAELTMLLDNGVDLHSYSPTVSDIVNIATCDMFIYVGGESDEWVDGALAQATNSDMVVVNLMEVLADNVVAEEEVGEEEHEHEEGDHEHEHENDEHVWLSLRNAQIVCSYIADKLGEIDPENAEVYEDNAARYNAQLHALDEEYTTAVENAACKTLLFADRFPFRYLTEDYGLEYYAAFSGCSTETNASADTIAFLVGKVNELGLTSVLIIDGSDGKVAQTVVSETETKDQSILTLDSIQSVTLSAAKNVTYLSLMQSNLEVLKTALRVPSTEKGA